MFDRGKPRAGSVPAPSLEPVLGLLTPLGTVLRVSCRTVAQTIYWARSKSWTVLIDQANKPVIKAKSACNCSMLPLRFWITPFLRQSQHLRGSKASLSS